MSAGRVAPDVLLIAREGCDMSRDSDEALAALGDAESFVLLYRRYLTPVYRYLYSRLGNREEAEDVTALAWERVLSSLRHYKPTGRFPAWLFTIARRALADHYRHHRRERGPQGTALSLSAEALHDMLPDLQAGPEEKVIAADEMNRALAALSRLGSDRQEIITLRFMAGLSYGEIAQVVGKREPAVKMMAYRALAELRETMSREL